MVAKQLFAYRVPTSISLNVMAVVPVRARQSDRAKHDFHTRILGSLEIVTFRIPERHLDPRLRIYQDNAFFPPSFNAKSTSVSRVIVLFFCIPLLGKKHKENVSSETFLSILEQEVNK